ncbi:HD domain-containing protein [Enterococcus plantarum]|uniref:HD domain-containing protein n=1 Tax=Enterococcus plantarum TaxID=1077675 RepID=UPI001A8E81EF|nr:HD domain-containing protein [Enterococcus plantarum]MBO0421491.1 HD domain-containing protein [Enterococcus plantarum]
MDNKYIDEIRRFSLSKMEKDQTGHGLDHINRVVRLADKIAGTETCNHFIVTAAAYLHDTVDDKLVPDSHQAFQQMEEFLQDINVPNDQIQQITHIIMNLSFSQEINGTAEKLTIEGQIVQDADRLDAMGAIGIMRTIYYGARRGNPIYNPEIKPRTLQSKAEYREECTIINHFYEKILLLNKSLNTEYAKVLGQKRQEFLEGFLTEFFEEWN